MRRQFLALPTVMLLAATLVGCSSDSPMAPAGSTPEQLEGRSMSTFINNPDGGGLRIFRANAHIAFLSFDPRSSLAAVATTLNLCDGAVLEPADVQDVDDDPSAFPFTRTRELILADVNIHIIDRSEAGSCFGARWIASGTGKFVLTDNDLNAFLRPNNNANSFGYSTHGLLTDGNGHDHRFSGGFRAVWDGEDFATMQRRDRFNLHPVGKP